MIARAHETCRGLSRRVRDDLIHLGLVDDTGTAALRDGAWAGAGDLIVARRNDHQLRAGEQQRTLANGDVMRIDRVNGDGSLTVRRRTGQDPQTGRARWSTGTFRFADTANADLAYAVTGHSAQGLTISHGIAVVIGSEGRQWFYSAITRGADCNQAACSARTCAAFLPCSLQVEPIHGRVPGRPGGIVVRHQVNLVTSGSRNQERQLTAEHARATRHRRSAERRPGSEALCG